MKTFADRINMRHLKEQIARTYHWTECWKSWKQNSLKDKRKINCSPIKTPFIDEAKQIIPCQTKSTLKYDWIFVKMPKYTITNDFELFIGSWFVIEYCLFWSLRINVCVGILTILATFVTTLWTLTLWTWKMTSDTICSQAITLVKPSWSVATVAIEHWPGLTAPRIIWIEIIVEVHIDLQIFRKLSTCCFLIHFRYLLISHLFTFYLSPLCFIWHY